MVGKLSGKRALITGGSRGIGRAIAEAFAREACSLILNARESGRLTRTADEVATEYGVDVCVERRIFIEIWQIYRIKVSICTPAGWVTLPICLFNLTMWRELEQPGIHEQSFGISSFFPASCSSHVS